MSKKRKKDQIAPLSSEGDSNLSAERQAWQARQTDPDTLDLLARDEAVFLHQSLSTPCLDVLHAAKDSELKNLQNHTYADFHGNSVHQVGFGHPSVVAAIRHQLETLPFCPRRFTNRPAVELAEKLVELADPGLDRVLFSPGGTSAIGMALKIARTVTGRFKTISMWDSFHGASLDAISIGGEADFRKDIGPLLPGTEHVPPPNPADCPFKCGKTCSLQCADYVDYVLEKEGDVAAVISESVSSVPYFPPVDYWKRIREACDRHNALLILDEIPHSLGRTGKLFTYQHYGIVPDMLVLGKGLGGGIMPLAAVLSREDFNVAENISLGHYTHEKNPVACAAGLATLRVIVDEQLPQRSQELGEFAIELLNEMLKDVDLVSDIRGLGLLIGIELGQSNEESNTLANKVMYRCLSGGVSFKISMGNVLTLAPPLTIDKDLLERSLRTIADAIRQTADHIH